MKYLTSELQDLVSIREIDVPVPGQGEITVRLSLCGVCGTDVLKVFGAFPRPQKLGHEVVGVVEQVGAGVISFVPGQRVALAHHAPDPRSYHSQRGSETMDAQFKASNIFPGGFSEVIRVPADLVPYTVLAIPDHVPDTRAVFMEPMACCLRALDRMALQRGDTALVVGIGAVGMLFVPLLRDIGVKVVVTDVRPDRVAAAAKWGAVGCGADQAPVLSKQYSDGRGVDAVILTVANDATLQLAMTSVRDGGLVMLFGAKPGAMLHVLAWELFTREINLLTSYSATPDGLKRAMSMLSQDRYAGLEALVSHTLTIAEGQSAFELARNGRVSKVVVTGTT